MILLVHILTASLGLLSGYFALSVAKGAPLHRKIGMLFVYVMLTMSLTGMLISAVEGVAPAINIPTALLTSYLVITSLTTVRPAASRRVDVAAMVMGLVVGLVGITLALAAIGKGGREVGMAYPLVLFGAIAFLASGGDRRVIRAGGLRGAPRLARHLWRMCFALFIASGSFFLGQMKFVPEPFRILPLMAALGVGPLFVLLYGMWRVRLRHSLRGIMVKAQKPSSLA